MTEALKILWYLYVLLQVFLALYLIHPFVLILIFFIKRAFGFKPKNIFSTPITKNYQFGIVVTAHQETVFIPPIVDSLLKQNYPNFNVYIVADDCDITNLHFDDPRINILKPPVAFNTNSKSIAYAVEHFKSTDEILVIFDPDNLVHPKFLEVLNIYYNKGYKAVQGNLQSKNTQGKYAKIDTIGIIFNTFIDRDIRSELGLCVSIWGCGVSVDANIYRRINYDGRSQMGGFDKKMQAEIVKSVSTIAYAPAAIVYDEKVIDANNFERQRTRWISSYFKFFSESIDLFFTGIKRRNFSMAYFGYNLIRPPYFILVLAAILFIKLNFFIHKGFMLGWLAVLCLFVLSFIIIVITKAANKSVSKAIFYMPLFFFHQVRSLFKIKMNNKSILKTSHSQVLYIDDILKNEAI
jgi:cellulose synthase/poly-beta-1,6-N-acetylglucosamine synthase-like glycosyltransferase